MRLFSDKIATVTALIGVLLMVATILTRVNPAEGSVIRPEFLKTPLGQPITLFLLIASAPGWIGIMLSMPLAQNAAILADSEKIAPLYYVQQIEGLRPDLDIMVLPDEAAYRAVHSALAAYSIDVNGTAPATASTK